MGEKRVRTKVNVENMVYYLLKRNKEKIEGLMKTSVESTGQAYLENKGYASLKQKDKRG